MGRKWEDAMKQMLVGVAVVLCVVSTAWAQQGATEAEIRRAVPYSTMLRTMPTLTIEQYNQAVRELARTPRPPAPTPRPVYLGTLSANPYLPDSTSNLYGIYGSPYSPKSTTNPVGEYGSRYSPKSPTNPYATTTPKVYGQDGTYLGKLSTNPYAPDSISNPYGRYGSPYSPSSVNNPYGIYGSPFSPLSPNNPYAVKPPIIIGRDK